VGLAHGGRSECDRARGYIGSAESHDGAARIVPNWSIFVRAATERSLDWEIGGYAAPAEGPSVLPRAKERYLRFHGFSAAMGKPCPIVPGGRCFGHPIALKLR